MATLSKSWEDGSGDSVTITPSVSSGDATVTISTPKNDGIDRSMSVSVSGSSIVRSFTISQLGLREIFVPTDDDAFNASDGGFYVLKS